MGNMNEMEKKRNIITVFLVYPHTFQYFSSGQLKPSSSGLVPPAGGIEWKPVFPTVKEFLRVPKMLPTEAKPPLSNNSLCLVSRDNGTLHILGFSTLCTWHTESSFTSHEKALAVKEFLTFVRYQSRLRNSQSTRRSFDH